MAGRKCEMTADDGKPCKAWALKRSSYCFFHDPENAEEAQKASRKGGQTAHIFAQWKVPDISMPLRRGPLAIAEALEQLAGLALRKEVPPTVINAAVGALRAAATSYAIAAAVQADHGDPDIGIVLEHGRKGKGFKLVFSHEADTSGTKQIDAPAGEALSDVS